jgi:DNA-binding NarL/FixJ family response regulator
MPFKSIRLGIVDPHALLRKILRNYLSEQQNIQIPIQVSDMLELFQNLKADKIDILLMDMIQPELNAFEAIKLLRNEYPDIRILVLSMNMDMNLISDLLDAGIHGYVSKSDEPDELLHAIHTIAENRIYRNRIYTEALYWNRQNAIRDSDDKFSMPLSEREKRILQMIWNEKSNKEIAKELFLGVRSVEKIRQDLKDKLGVKSTVGMLKYAITKKIIQTDSHPVGLIM